MAGRSDRDDGHKSIDGITRVLLTVERKTVPAAIYVSPDITGTILGIDWLSQPGNLWDFGGRRIKIGDGDWIPLGPSPGFTCNRIYGETDVVLPPRQETTVNARMPWRDREICQ